MPLPPQAEKPAVPPDMRTLDEMPFAGTTACSPDMVRAILSKCGVAVARDIELVGCTGAAAAGLHVEEISELRLAVGGGGVGLPCFVPPTRFCLAHNTIGGLMPGQAMYHQEHVDSISRPLTPEERGKVKLMEAAIRTRGKDSKDKQNNAHEVLTGYTLPEGFEAVAEDGGADFTKPDVTPEERVRLMEAARWPGQNTAPPVVDAWRCPEHPKPAWNCRYCAAQAVVEGALEPVYAFSCPDDVGTELTPEALERRIDTTHTGAADIYVKVAHLTRKLSR